ncbi:MULTISPECIES: hypothetical protein [unclassified Streptomyces]|uniref:hypothetical protein n=1 Tax=unclassified Streptomyces TaxID=2593676 RepID=UPI002F9180E3
MDIEPSAFGPIRAVAAEHVVAHWLASQGDSPVLKGGRTRGHDIVNGDQLIDAKLLVAASNTDQKKYPGCTHKLRRDLWRAFDPARTTHLMFVEFPPDWIGMSSTSFTETVIRIRHEGIGLFLFSVAEFNKVLASGRAEAEEKRWAYIILDREWLEEHRVY